MQPTLRDSDAKQTCNADRKPQAGYPNASESRLALTEGFAHKGANQTEPRMPTLFRFLFILAVIAGVIYGSMMALVLLVEPKERDVTVRVPSERLNPPAPAAPARP
jgi:hypothetical protein